MAKKRVTRKQLLKEPDEFITTTGKLIGWARDHIKHLIGGASLLVGLLVLIVGYGYYQEKQSDAATALYSKAMQKYQAAGGEKDPVNALAAAKPEFERLAKEFSGQPAGKQARIIYGHFSLAAQAREEAVAIYLSALKDFASDPTLANFIRDGLAAAYSQKGEFPAAIEQYEKVVAGNSQVLKDAALFHLGRLYEAMGQSDQSQKVYKDLFTDFPESMFTEMVKDKIAG
jgi:tetratricopeptide (TPR) repeat protein